MPEPLTDDPPSEGGGETARETQILPLSSLLLI